MKLPGQRFWIGWCTFWVVYNLMWAILEGIWNKPIWCMYFLLIALIQGYCLNWWLRREPNR